MQSLSQFAQACMQLPEFDREGGGAGLPVVQVVTLDMLVAAFQEHEQALKTTEMWDSKAWLEGELPPAVLREVRRPPDWSKDRLSPFVRKIRVETNQRLAFFGDLHGSIHSLLRQLLRLMKMGVIDDAWRIVDPQFKMFFLGDFVDRGAYGLEVWFTVMTLAGRNPTSVYLCRGNHEEHETWKLHSFAHEIYRKLPGKGPDPSNGLLHEEVRAKKMFSVFNDKLPHAIYAGWLDQDNKEQFIQCSHGGIEPRFDPRPLLTNSTGAQFTLTGPNFAGLNWSDFTGLDHPKTQTSHEYTRNTRGGSSGFLADIPDTQLYLETYGLRAFFRGHQDDESSFKLLKRGLPWVVGWGELGHTVEGLQKGLSLASFENTQETAPVFTFSTAAEGRGLPDEGFGVLHVRPQWSDWSLAVYVFPLQRASAAANNS